MLNSVGERMPSCEMPVLNSGCVVSICCVGFASLVVYEELNDCAWNVCL